MSRGTYTFRIYQDAAGEWRWRLEARNGKTVADSGEGYKTRAGARRAVDRLMNCTMLQA